MTEKLIQIASLAESFTEQRPKSSRSTWSHLADSLDQEGPSSLTKPLHADIHLILGRRRSLEHIGLD